MTTPLNEHAKGRGEGEGEAQDGSGHGLQLPAVGFLEPKVGG